MTPEIIARVDAWLAHSTRPVLWLNLDWRTACLALADRQTDRGRASCEAAMTGILVALVREAWGMPNLRPGHYQRIGFPGSRPYRPEMWSICPPESGGPYEGETEAECLVVCLEAAPE